MSGMPLAQAFLLAASACILVFATQSRRLHPFIAIVLVASAFGLAAGFSVGFLGKAFGVNEVRFRRGTSGRECDQNDDRQHGKSFGKTTTSGAVSAPRPSPLKTG